MAIIDTLLKDMDHESIFLKGKKSVIWDIIAMQLRSLTK
jgi:hypothetical protein